MKTSKVLAALILAAILTASCSSVQLTPQGRKARVLSSQEVQKCDPRGTATVTVPTRIVGIPRQQTSVANELRELARNTAATMGGDTVVPVSKIRNGSQRYNIYKCVP